MKRIVKQRVIFWCCVFIIFPLVLQAQVQLQPTYNAQDGLALEELWQVQINYLAPEAIQVRLVAEVWQEGQQIYARESQPFALQLGQQSPTPSLLRMSKEHYGTTNTGKRIRQLGHLPEGKYQVCQALQSVDRSASLGRHCVQVVIDERMESVSTKKIQWSGQGRVEHVYSNQAFFGNTLPRQFVRVDAHPTLQIQDIPLGLDIFYTTEDQQFGPTANAISLRFDARQFQHQLRQKLERKVADQSSSIQQMHRADFLKEEYLAQVLDHASDSLVQVNQALQQQLQSELDQYAEKELTYWQKRLSNELDGPQQVFRQRERAIRQSADPKASTQLDSLDREYEIWRKAHKEDLQLQDSIQQAWVKLEDLRRRLSQVNQILQQVQQGQDQEAFLKDQYAVLTTQNDSLRQLLDVDQTLNDPKVLKKELTRAGLLEGQNRWLYAIKSFTIGTYRPAMSPIMLSGTQANGVEVGWSPDEQWRADVAVGKIQAPFFGVSSEAETDFYEPTVLSNKLSFSNRWMQTYLASAYAFNDDWSVESGTNLLPPPSLLLGGGFVFSFLEGALNAQGDLAWADRIGVEEPTDWRSQMAWNAALDWQLHDRVHFLGVYQSTGTQYEDIGSPLVLPGLEHIEGQINTIWWQGQLQFGLFYLKDKNRPLAFSPFTFANHQLGVQAAWQGKKGLQLQGRMGRNFLEQEGADGQAYLWSSRMLMPYKVAGLSMQSQASFQHTQQQLAPALPPQLITYLEGGHLVQWSSSWSNEILANLSRTGNSEQDLSGLDLRTVFQAKAFSCTLSKGYYTRNQGNWRFRGNLNVQWKFSPVIGVQLQGGIFPSFIQQEDFFFVRTALMSQF